MTQETVCIQKKCDWLGHKFKKKTIFFKVEINLDLKKHNGDTVKTQKQTNEKIPNHRQMHRKLIFYRVHFDHNYFLIDFFGVFCWKAESFISLIKWLLTLWWSSVFYLSLHLFRTGTHISSNFFQFIHSVWAEEWSVSTCLYFKIHLILRFAKPSCLNKMEF